MAGRKRTKRYFGSVRQLPSKRWQARYPCPRPVCGKHHPIQRDGKSLTFDTAGDADAALSRVQTEIRNGTCRPPCLPVPVEVAPLTLRQYVETWLAERELAQRTRDDYRLVLDNHVLPDLGDMLLTGISPADVRTWYAKLARGDGDDVRDRPAVRARAYGLLRSIMRTAADDDLIDSSPCRVRGAGRSKPAVEIRLIEPDELVKLVQAIPERFRLMVLLAAWCALRFGELAELRRSDVDLKAGVVKVRRAMSRTRGGATVRPPKSEAGRRDVAIPPHLLPAVKQHLSDYVTGRTGLLFPAESGPDRPLPAGSMLVWFKKARRAAGRPDVRFHDLRHFGGTMAARTGATLKELMARLGHSSPQAAMRYQHAAAERDKAIAAALSEFAKVTPLASGSKGAAG